MSTDKHRPTLLKLLSVSRGFFDHTGDVGVTVAAATLPDLFREAAFALTETLTDLDAVRPNVQHSVELAATRLDDLLVAWLDELLYQFEVRALLVRDAALVVERSGSGWKLTGVLRGEPFDAGRHSIKVLIKAVTYHRLDVRREEDEWRTDLVFDI